MRKFKLTDALRVDIKVFDDDHAFMIECFNSIEDALNRGDHHDVSSRLDILLVEARRHFRREETVLAKYDFPDLVEHKAGHDRFMTLAHETVHHWQAKRDSAHLTESLESLAALGIERLINDDLRYKWFFRDRAITPSAADLPDDNGDS